MWSHHGTIHRGINWLGKKRMEGYYYKSPCIFAGQRGGVCSVNGNPGVSNAVNQRNWKAGSWPKKIYRMVVKVCPTVHLEDSLSFVDSSNSTDHWLVWGEKNILCTYFCKCKIFHSNSQEFQRMNFPLNSTGELLCRQLKCQVWRIHHHPQRRQARR